MKSFFNPDNWLWQSFSRLADYFLVSICWLICSIPLVTIGTASIALYDTVAHCIKGSEGGLVRRFFRTFKNELLRGCLLTILWTAVAFVLNMGYQILVQNSEGNTAVAVVSIVYFCALFIPLGCICWSIALESRFSASFGQMLKNSFAFTLAYLPQTFVIVALFVLALNLCLNFPFFVMAVPGVMAHLQSHCIEKVFQKYMPEEAEESIEEASR